MKKPLLLPIAILAVLCILHSCRKEDSGQTVTYASLNDVRLSLARQPTVLNIDAATGGTFAVARCTISIPANAFQNAAGAGVGGIINIEISDILTKSEMMFSRALPVSYGDPLISGGELNIQAWQNGFALQLKPGATIQIKVPQFGRDPAGMMLFTGQIKEDSVARGNLMNWSQQKSPGTIIVGNDTVTIVTDSLGWVNADRFMTNPNYQSFTLTVSGVSLTRDDYEQINAYAFYDNYNGAWPLLSLKDNIFSENHVPNIPVHFVAYAVIGGKLYGGVAAATPANGSNYNIDLQLTTPTAFKSRVDAL